VKRRLKNLQTVNGSPLVLVATFPGHEVIEESIHEHFQQMY